jgi:hypothetical protein
MPTTDSYVGVTGFMSRKEVNEALAMVPKGSTRRLMVGVLMSSKTFDGQPNNWPGRYPKREAVADIFPHDPRALNLIHYTTDRPKSLFSQLMGITEYYGGPNLDGFQLNISWPSVEEINKYWESQRKSFLVLQVGSKAMAEVESIEHFVDLVGAYLPMVKAVLINPGSGKRKPLDAAEVEEYFSALRSAYPKLGLVAAGGLGPDTLHLIHPLIQKFSGLSSDAERLLRTPPPEDALYLPAMRIYLRYSF